MHTPGHVKDYSGTDEPYAVPTGAEMAATLAAMQQPFQPGQGTIPGGVPQVGGGGLYNTLGVPQVGGQSSPINLLTQTPNPSPGARSYGVTNAPLAPYGGVNASQQAAAGQHFANQSRAQAGSALTAAQLARAGVGGKVGLGLGQVGLGAFANQLKAARPWLQFAGGMAAMPFQMMPNLPGIDLDLGLPEIDLGIGG